MVKDKLRTLADESQKTIKTLMVETVEAHGAISRAAQALGVTPNTFHYHMKRNHLVAYRTRGKTVLREDSAQS